MGASALHYADDSLADPKRSISLDNIVAESQRLREMLLILASR
jgi:hypothetical protein